jgi:hypothetical protein
MADNIKIVGEILSTQQVPRYDEADLRLLSPQLLKEDFGQQNDYIEYFVYDIGNNLLNINYNYKDFKLPDTSYINPTNNSLPIIEIDPIKDLQSLGYSSGEFKVQYNFFNNKVSDPNQSGLFIKEISSDRTELRLGSTVLTNEQIESVANSLISEYTGSLYFVDYLLNFGDNTQVVAVNTALNKVDSGYEILFKLYEPLPSTIQEKVTLWVVEEKVNPYIFDINLDKLVLPIPGPQLRGPNFSIDIPNQNNTATSYQTYTGLINNLQNVSSSYQQLLSIITSQSIDINVDYSNFSNFIFFSSAKQRVVNFYNKVKQIEDYKTNLSVYTPLTASYPNLINDYNSTTSSINNIISNFDGFEYYLYFESGSSITSSTEFGVIPYPKSGSLKPFVLYSTGSTSASLWLSSLTSSADDYDDYNQNKLTFTVPSFIKDDENNTQYLNFLDMVGHYFDNIWIYLQAVTDINLANNNLEQGVSKDLVYNVLQSLGAKLYNKYGDTSDDIFLIGQDSGSTNFDNNFTPTGSYLNNIPRKDLLAETYKRIYHNLPLLLKTRGTAYGLQTLISTFGITGSILNVKEYGGDLKNQTLDEYSTDKIRIISSNIVTGSILSPYISLQQPTTTSSLFRTNDLHYVDISFSPETQIDTYASAAIAGVNPTWNLDDYIGDPRQMYSSSYNDLNTQRNTYYNFTSSYMDYAGFIRLIQFFDNSLFKMLKDYVPARASLSTGITISSPVLERNKFVYANPSSTSKINVNEGTIDGPTIGTEYTDIYEHLTGSRAAYYTGEFEGDIVNYNDIFTEANFNPYLQFNTASWNSQYPSASINLNTFVHSNFNVLLNNVSSSLISNTRQNIQFIYGTSQNILSPAELQDSYESLKSYQVSRYEGVKLYSLLYNNYTSASSTYGGDLSYGKTAVINKNVRKIGLFTDIVSSSLLPGRNRASLKYLVDDTGNLTELNQRNNHWEEIQRTFVAGEYLNVSQFDNQKFGNQKTTDGNKLIFDSGYAYYPILYFASCSVDSKIFFQSLGQAGSYLAEAINTPTPGTISGSTSPTYPISGGFVKNIFNTEIVDASNIFQPGTLTGFPSYSVAETGDYRVQASFDLDVTLVGGGSYTTWSLQVFKNNDSTPLYEDEYIFTLGGGTAQRRIFIYYTSITTNNVVRITNNTNTNSTDITSSGGSTVVGSQYITVPSDGSTTSVTFTISKISPDANADDATVVDLVIDSITTDSFNISIGNPLSGTLTGNMGNTSVVAININEG